jgi:hypothetical protein
VPRGRPAAIGGGEGAVSEVWVGPPMHRAVRIESKIRGVECDTSNKHAGGVAW